MDETGALAWEDPPGQKAGGSDKYSELAEQLRAHPKRWARVLTSEGSDRAHQFAGNIRKGRVSAFRQGNWEAVGRKLDDGRYATYARFVGDDE
jgi:hypothetical protein